jgi:hypothetical protein
MVNTNLIIWYMKYIQYKLLLSCNFQAFIPKYQLGAITSAASLRSLPGILSCSADLDVLIVEILYTLVNETLCIVNCVSGLVTYDSGDLELCGMLLTKRDATSLKCEFKASAISCFFSQILIIVPDFRYNVKQLFLTVCL